MWTQIVGKIRLAQAPAVNHWWHPTLYVTARGVTTSAMPHDGRTFQIDFDFLDHVLRISADDGAVRTLALEPRSVADSYAELMATLREMALPVSFWPIPVEVADPIPFADDRQHASYDPAYAQRFWRILLETERALSTFQGRFLGKSSPAHFFWGSFDMAVMRFSGRTAPPHPGSPLVADFVTLDAYSHEVISAGFWPGGWGVEEPAFYAYAYPEPAGFKEAAVAPTDAFYYGDLGEYLLPYEAVRTAADPDAALMDFLQTTYEAAADRAGWDRAGLERDMD